MGQLTTEDEERRRRRRERNKVAATKCRNRKKERTGILMKESDVLEDQNSNFRSEIQRLESEKRRLLDVLAMHSSSCLKTGNFEETYYSRLSGCKSFLSPVQPTLKRRYLVHRTLSNQAGISVR